MTERFIQASPRVRGEWTVKVFEDAGGATHYDKDLGHIIYRCAPLSRWVFDPLEKRVFDMPLLSALNRLVFEVSAAPRENNHCVTLEDN